MKDTKSSTNLEAWLPPVGLAHAALLGRPAVLCILKRHTNSRVHMREYECVRL